MSNNLRQAAQAALEALTLLGPSGVERRRAAEMLRAALAEPQPEPNPLTTDMGWLWTHCRAIGMTRKSDSGLLHHDIALFTHELVNRQPQPEPVAWIRYASDGTYEGPLMDHQMEPVRKSSGAWTPLYAAPQAQQQPLTDEQISEIRWSCRWQRMSTEDSIVSATKRNLDDFARAIERAHGIGKP